MIRCFAFLVFFCCGSYSSFGQTNERSESEEGIHTIMWKISGSKLKQSSYLLGIHHMIGIDWLYNFPEVKKIIETSDYLLTELYGDNNEADSLPEHKIKALDILTSEEFSILDSFFVVRVGEGIADNEVAEAMDVFEMCSAILSTLLAPREGDEHLGMDYELFKFFQYKSKTSFRMDDMKYLAFNEEDTVRAREIMRMYIEAVKIGDHPAWNLADTTYGLGLLTQSYKDMSFKYHLAKEDPQKKSPIANQTVKERNRMWIPMIEERISKHKCLIAVGFYHLCYDTGLIVLLRQQGYTVEPVTLSQI